MCIRDRWELHRQLKLQCEELWNAKEPSPPRKREPADGATPQAPPVDASVRGNDGNNRDYASLHRALLTGLPTQIGHLAERGVYDGPRGRKFQLFPGSRLASKPPPWVLSATLLDTEKIWAITNAAIEPDWVIAGLPHLLSRRHHDPRWSRAQGRVLGSEQISLFGLVLHPRKPVHYGALYPEEARAIFAHDALVAGEINTRSAFLARNLRTLQSARDEEAKLRRAGLVVDEDWMARWYLDRLPAHVHNAQALDAWYGKLSQEHKAALEWTRDDLLVADQTDAALFPAYIALGNARLAVKYRFEPGAVDDGMTLALPLHLLNAVDPARLSWLAPGLVQEKAAALIRSLPKALRRNFVPAPDFAGAFAQAHREPEADAIEGVLARFLGRLTGVEVSATDFQSGDIAPHLRMNIRLLDADGRHVLAESRELDELRARFGQRAADAFARHAAQGMARAGLTAFPHAPIPVSVPGAGGVPAYPALQDDGDAASLAVHARREEADRLHPGGVRRLLAIALADKLKQARKQLPVQPRTSLLYAAIESVDPRRDGLKDADRLRADLVDGAFAALTADGLGEVRDPAAFAQLAERISRQLFPEAMSRLQQAEGILAAVADVRAALESRLMGWARGNLDDMRDQLDALARPGFLREVPAQALAEYPRWLKALAIRAQRAQADPAKDQARMLELKPFADALQDAPPEHPGWQALRWQLEELRVSLFAQELGTKGQVSPKKLAGRLRALRGEA